MKKEYREHGKSYKGLEEDIIIEHLKGMSDKELANILERKIPRVREKRTELVREAFLNAIGSSQYFVRACARLKLLNDKLMNKLIEADINLDDINVTKDEIETEVALNFELVRSGKSVDKKYSNE
mgnify:FL=1